MVLDEERISMKIQAMGRAVMELSLADLPMTQQNIIDKLEQYRKETGNVIGKGGTGMRRSWCGRVNKNPAQWPGGGEKYYLASTINSLFICPFFTVAFAVIVNMDDMSPFVEI